MVTKVHDTTCRSCGAAADIGQTKCLYCKQPVLISTFSSVFSMPMPMVNQYAATYREALQNETTKRSSEIKHGNHFKNGASKKSIPILETTINNYFYVKF